MIALDPDKNVRTLKCDAQGRLLTAAPVTVSTADLVDYDNSTSGLTATNVQAAIDELAASGGGGGGDDSRPQELSLTHSAADPIYGIDPTLAKMFKVFVDDADWEIAIDNSNAGGEFTECWISVQSFATRTLTVESSTRVKDGAAVSLTTDSSGSARHIFRAFFVGAFPFLEYVGEFDTQP